MKFSTMIVGAFAAVVAAAPAPVVEERSNVDINLLNGLRGFSNLDFNYLFSLNALDLNALHGLGLNNNLNLLQFQNVFNARAFDLHSLLQFQQLHTVLALHQQGLFSQFDLRTLNLGAINLGLINNVGAVDLAQFIDVSFLPQITQIANQKFTIPIKE